MRFLDFSSWHGVMTTLLGFSLFMLMGMGMRVLMMMTVQQRQQRMNRQINERLRTLMAAYKVLGGSFTGMLQVDPRSRRKYLAEAAPAARRAAEPGGSGGRGGQELGTVVSGVAVTSERVTVETAGLSAQVPGGLPSLVIERRIQMRDAVEAALSDVLLLGTEEHVRLAARAAEQLAAGNPIQTAELVASLRAYIRKALGLEALPADVVIPAQGPTRPGSGGGRAGRPEGERGREGGSGQGAGAGGGMEGGGMGMGMGLGMGAGRGSPRDDP